MVNITITPAAARFIKRILRFSGLGSAAGLRLTVTPGGCSGYSSEFSPEGFPQADEQMFDIGGVRLFLGVQSRSMLDGITIDSVETATQSGLTFTDPNKPACACSSAGAMPRPSVTKVEISAIGRARPAPVLTP